MRSKTNKSFRDLYDRLAPDIKRQAREAYRQFQHDPFSPGLNFEPINKPRNTIWSARINDQFRVIGARHRNGEDRMVWFWIGSHNEYDYLVRKYRGYK